MEKLSFSRSESDINLSMGFLKNDNNKVVNQSKYEFFVKDESSSDI